MQIKCNNIGILSNIIAFTYLPFAYFEVRTEHNGLSAHYICHHHTQQYLSEHYPRVAVVLGLAVV